MGFYFIKPISEVFEDLNYFGFTTHGAQVFMPTIGYFRTMCSMTGNLGKAIVEVIIPIFSLLYIELLS